MATVNEYLEKLRQENPQLRSITDFDLYRTLKDQDENMPSWESVDASLSKAKRTKNKHELKQNPDFLNSFFDWTDWGINESSANWAKSAYNNSITGLAYQLHNGEEKFDLDNYDPGIVEDIFSAVLSFSMPFDIASMFVGGLGGKALGGLAGSAQKQAIVKHLSTKAGMKSIGIEGIKKKATREKLAKAYAEDLIEKKGYSTLFGAYAPRANAVINQGSTLAVFEGVRGGMQAAVDGTNIWEGIGHGVMHGGIMGGIAGFTGASLNIKHAKLFNKLKKGPLTAKEKIAYNTTGVIGQVGAEATVFTAPDLKNVITEDGYTMKDLMRNWAVNMGMMGILKAKSKLMKEGQLELAKYMKEEGEGKASNSKKSKESHKELEETVNNLPEETAEQRQAKKDAQKEVQRFVENQLKNEDVDIKDYENWEKDFNEAIDIINKGDKAILTDKGVENILKVKSQVDKVIGAMNRNISRYNKDYNIERRAEIELLEALTRRFEKEIIEPMNDMNKAETSIKKRNKGEERQIEFNFNEALSDAKRLAKEGDTKPLEILTRNLKGYDASKQELTKNIDYGQLERRAEDYAKTRKFLEKRKEDIDTDKETSKDKFEKEQGEAYDNIKEAEAEIQKLEADVNLSTAERQKQLQLQKNRKNIQSKEFKSEQGDTKEIQRKAYNENKKVLDSYAKDKILATRGTPGAKLNFAEKFSKHLAEQGKNFFKLTDKDIVDYLNKVGATPTNRASMRYFIEHLSKLRARHGRELFKNYNDFTLLESADKGVDLATLTTQHKKAQVDVGFRVPGSKFSNTNITKNKLTIFGKGVEIIKLVSDGLSKALKDVVKYSLNLRTESPLGHKDWMFKTITGEALTTSEVNVLVKQFFGERIFTKGEAGEGRLFRKSIEEWVVSKKDKVENWDKYEFAVDKIIVGHAGKKVSEFYQQGGFKNEIAAKKFVDKVLKEYYKDIKSGEFNKTFDLDVGYTPKEIKAGLDKLKLEGKDISFVDRNGNKQYIDKKTLETMFKYMIETGPRLNEIAPTKELLKEYEIRAEKLKEKEIYKEEFQLESELKAGEQIIKTKELTNQVKWVEKYHPRLSVQLQKSLGKHQGKYVLGKIQNHLINIAEGRARFDTLPHEVAHHVVDVLKEIGDPMSKKLVKTGTKMFKSEEAFVEALGKYAAKELPKSTVGKMKSWVSRTVNYLRQYFKITNENDVTRMQREIVSIIGGKVLSGKIPTNYLTLKSKLKTKYQKSDTKVGENALKRINIEVHRIERDLKKNLNITDSQLKELRKDILGDTTWSMDKITVGELEVYQNRLNTLYQGRIEGKSKNESFNESKVKEIEMQYDISDVRRDAYFNDVFGVKFENATPSMIRSYKNYISLGKEVTSLNQTIHDQLISISKQKTDGGMSLWSRPFMRAADVIKRMGKVGEFIARKLELHDYTRSVTYKGPGEVVIEQIRNIVDKRTANKYMHFVDKNIATNAIKQVRKLAANNKQFKSELKEMEIVFENLHGKNGKYKEAKELWKGLSDFYWNSLTIEISRNTRSSKEFQDIIKNLNKKYVQEYFVRRPRREVIEALNEKHPALERIIKNSIKKLSKSDLKKIEKDSGYKQGTSEFKIAKREAIQTEIMQMIEFGPAKARPFFLKERSVTLPEYIKIKDKKGVEKLVKSYESGIEATMQSYVNGMSKFLATVKHFPEFTELGGKFSLKSEAKIKVLDLMANKDVDGAYAYLAIKRQLGMDYALTDVLSNKTLNTFGRITNWSAVAGLSSPLAGLKNLLIQIPRSLAVYGTRNTMRGIAKATKAMRDPKEMMKAIERGETGYGQKELLYGTDKTIQWWFKNVNFMEKTENFNRIMVAEAGRLHFAELVNVFRGESSIFHPQGKPKEIERMFRETWRLGDKEINHLKNEVDLYNSTKYEDILNYVGFSSHKASAGATGVADLPLWMSNKYVKPLTLFQRMAGSVTIDSYKNYVKPMKNGNFAPMIKATIAHGVTGAALFTIYDKLLGQQVPTEDNPLIDKAVSYVWRGEMLGVFGEIISPYMPAGNVNPLMEPVIIRNFRNAGDLLLKTFKYKKPVKEAINDFAKNTLVIYGQLEKGFYNLNQPYATNYKRIKALEKSWRRQMGVGYSEPGGKVQSTRTSAYWTLKKAIMFGKSDSEIARAYYVAYDAICTEYEAQGIVSKSLREKKARKAIESVIRHMSPLDISSENKGRIQSKRNEFLNFLSQDNRKLAIALEKEYSYKVRKFFNIVGRGKWKQLYSIYPY